MFRELASLESQTQIYMKQMNKDCSELCALLGFAGLEATEVKAVAVDVRNEALLATCKIRPRHETVTH